MVRTRQQSLAATAATDQEQEEEDEEGTEGTTTAVKDDGYPEQGSADDFIIVGAEILNRAAPLLSMAGTRRRSRAFNERWTAHFHVEPEVCEDVWKRLEITEFDGVEEEGEPCHLLWAFLFLKTYATLSVLSSMCGGVDEDTISKWVWVFVSKISYLEFDVVSLFYLWALFFFFLLATRSIHSSHWRRPHHLISSRLFGHTDCLMTLEMTASSRTTVLIV